MIRALTPDDAEAAAILIRAAFAATEVPVQPPPSALRVTAAHIADHLARGGGGAIADGDGCVLWSTEGDGLYIGRLAVQPAARGMGLATALLEVAEQAARAAGLSCLRLQVRVALTGNRRLFRRASFIEGAHHAHPGFSAPTYLEAEKRFSPPIP